MYQIGIDIGGTNVKIGLLDEALELTAETSVPFPHTTAADLAKKIRAAVLALLEEKNAALCDVGSLGAVVDLNTGNPLAGTSGFTAALSAQALKPALRG